jgi:hypothetical protein
MLMVVNYGWGEAQGFGYALPAGIDRPMLSYQPVVSYRIDAELKLDEAGRLVEIDGRQRLAWFNETNAEASELQFHLYLNAFRNERSTFLAVQVALFAGIGLGRVSGARLTFERCGQRVAKDLTRRIEFINPRR